MSQKPPVPTITLATVKQQFKKWRDNRQHRRRIPDELWEAAASLSGQYSIHYISKSLGVNHSALRDRIASRSLSKNTEIQTCFFELPPPLTPPTSECLVEMENIHGDKMRMHFTGEISLDLLALGQNFWRKCS
ncbi:MAG: hypothetical protein HOK67_05845 [Deltaproteobacteria bacterium]|mgnify:CR=1 FL=1|jgi:transposase-like protein|nr:hypothetical protein [Deltaproteobacteria bacterium]